MGHDSHGEVSKADDKIARIIARASVARPKEYPTWPASETGGVMAMSITSRFKQERQRLNGDFDEKWRKWRAQWIKDQQLHPNEPYHVPALEYERYNPIRRFYRVPGNWLENKLVKYMDREAAQGIRFILTRSVMAYFFGCWCYYMLKYSHRTWESPRRWNAWFKKPAVYPGDPRYPLPNPRPEKWQFADLEFSKRKVFKD
ncbi:NADH:ubiquinone oxidoreductase-like protein 1 [Dinothrombium tinctorium]|uniref:NADH:ubiquinone oxidoreductase-like protein 1 n=1 Tax=Dinothrombium tinctorium TaxID=1965070 RepID=A0A443RHJ0_9ACAR|nr:NADH:ubiquinone oxidoreductase-like protein 1 [Dinothrombium tinctorium]